MSVDNNVIGEIFTQMMLEVARAVDLLGVDRATQRQCSKQPRQHTLQCTNDDHCLQCIMADDVPVELLQLDIDVSKTSSGSARPKDGGDVDQDAPRIGLVPSHQKLSFYHAAVALFKVVGDVYPCIHCRNHYRRDAKPWIEHLEAGPLNQEPETMTKFVHQFKSMINAKQKYKNLDFMTLIARNIVFSHWCDAAKLWDLIIMIAIAMPSDCNDQVDPDLSKFYNHDAHAYVRETSAFRWRAFYQFLELLALLAEANVIKAWRGMHTYLWSLPDHIDEVAHHLIRQQYRYAWEHDERLLATLVHRVMDHQWFEDFFDKEIQSKSSSLMGWVSRRWSSNVPIPEDYRDLDDSLVPELKGPWLQHYVVSMMRIYAIPHHHQISNEFEHYM